jgi:DNA processing protein
VERDALAVLVSVEGLGPLALARLLGRLGTAAAVLAVARGGPHAVADLIAASADPTGEGRPMPEAVARALVAAGVRSGEILEGIRAAGLRLVTIADATYPARLRGIALPPHLLFVRGEPAALAPERAIGVVGTRRPTPGGRLIATRIAAALSRAGASVVSGLAVGIDGAAHAAALAERGLTVAVIGGGHGRLFPRAHRALADAIVGSGGAVVSEHPPDSLPTRGTFPRRNRIISGLSEAVVVVEAGARSGALTTAAWALEQGRDCFVVPGSIDAPMSAGCLSFLRECHGEARIVAGIPQLLEDLDLAVSQARPRVATRSALHPPLAAHPTGPSADAVLLGLSAAARRVGLAVADGLTTADELVAATRLPIAAVLGAITTLELGGLVVGAYGRYHPAGVLARAEAPAGLAGPVP